MIRLRLLGGASLQGPDGPIAGRSAQRRRLALLALLAVTRRPLSRERLMSYLWPDAETERARKLLSESLYVLRKEVHEDVVRVAGDELRLETAHVSCDVVDFEQALDRADARAAADLYGGPFLDGFFVEDADDFERWATTERDRLERRYRDALESLAGDAAGSGRTREAVDWWRRLAELDSFDGRVACALMNALAAAGDRAGALVHAREYERRMRDELGAAPDPAVASLSERLRVGDVEPATPTPTGRATSPRSTPAPQSPPTGESSRARLQRALSSEFEIDRLLGAGTTAEVYLGRERLLDRSVTIKLLKPEFAEDPASRARFEREARAAANVQHPNVSMVHRFGVLPEGEPYLVSDYLSGRTLEERLAAEGAFDIAATRRILGDVASALEAAHRQGVVHRDIRPGNIFVVEQDGRAVVTDFGIAAMTEAWAHGHEAKLTRTGQLLGDPRYVSPEQYRGEAVMETSDIYSMALVAYEMLTGRRPHADAGARAAAVARLTAEPIELPPAVRRDDPALADLLTRCLAADPRRRPSAAAVAQRMRAPADPFDDDDVPGDWLDRTWRALVRGRVPQWVAGAAAAGWLLLQAVDQLIQNAMLPRVGYRVALVTVLAAIPAAAVLAWYHGERGAQRFRPLEVLLLIVVIAVWLVGLAAALS